MGRVINTNNPGKRRNHSMRTIAEILRHLGQHSGEVDSQVRDMVAAIVLCLRDIDSTVIESIEAWEKRGYWQKADKFQVEWMWAAGMSKQVEALVRGEKWDELPQVMLKLYPRFADIEVNKLMRSESDWLGAYDELLASKSDEGR